MLDESGFLLYMYIFRMQAERVSQFGKLALIERIWFPEMVSEKEFCISRDVSDSLLKKPSARVAFRLVLA
jgi:hypothetical protein